MPGNNSNDSGWVGSEWTTGTIAGLDQLSTSAGSGNIVIGYDDAPASTIKADNLYLSYYTSKYNLKEKVEILLRFPDKHDELIIVTDDVKEVCINYQGKPYTFKKTLKKDKYGRYIFIVGKERKTLQPCIHTFKESLFTNEPFCIKCKEKQNG